MPPLFNHRLQSEKHCSRPKGKVKALSRWVFVSTIDLAMLPVTSVREPSAGEREGPAPRIKEPSAGEREGPAPRIKEPSAGEREGRAPRRQRKKSGAIIVALGGISRLPVS